MIKHNYREFGGYQETLLPVEMLGHYLCAVGGCTASGRVQVLLDPNGWYRILCGHHVTILSLLVMAYLRSPSPLVDARLFAEKFNVDWGLVERSEPIEVSTPEGWRCLRCGGAMELTPAGLVGGSRWAGREYYHRCGEG